MDSSGEQFYFFFTFYLGGFFIIFFLPYSALLYLPPPDSTVPTDAGDRPRTVATGALAVKRSNRKARSHPH
jgi:hypothetical protein